MSNNNYNKATQNIPDNLNIPSGDRSKHAVNPPKVEAYDIGGAFQGQQARTSQPTKFPLPDSTPHITGNDNGK